MSFWGAHEFRHNPKNRPPKKIPHEDCTAGIKVPCQQAKQIENRAIQDWCSQQVDRVPIRLGSGMALPHLT